MRAIAHKTWDSAARTRPGPRRGSWCLRHIPPIRLDTRLFAYRTPSRVLPRSETFQLWSLAQSVPSAKMPLHHRSTPGNPAPAPRSSHSFKGHLPGLKMRSCTAQRAGASCTPPAPLGTPSPESLETVLSSPSPAVPLHGLLTGLPDTWAVPHSHASEGSLCFEPFSGSYCPWNKVSPKQGLLPPFPTACPALSPPAMLGSAVPSQLINLLSSSFPPFLQRFSSPSTFHRAKHAKHIFSLAPHDRISR